MITVQLGIEALALAKVKDRLCAIELDKLLELAKCQ